MIICKKKKIKIERAVVIQFRSGKSEREAPVYFRKIKILKADVTSIIVSIISCNSLRKITYIHPIIHILKTILHKIIFIF